MTRPLTEEDKRRGFFRATNGMSLDGFHRWHERRAKGMTDDELREALAFEIGIDDGASSLPTVPGYHTKADGLQIWIHWHISGAKDRPPTFKGAATVAMAREIYCIRTPPVTGNMDLFGGAS